MAGHTCLGSRERLCEHNLQSCTSSGGCLLSLRSRGAAGGVLERLKRFPDAGLLVLHSLSGQSKELTTAVGFGCWFSVGLPMLRSKKGRLIVSVLPRACVLTETDGSSVACSGKAAEPWKVVLAATALASLWEETLEDARALLAGNLETQKSGFKGALA